MLQEPWGFQLLGVPILVVPFSGYVSSRSRRVAIATQGRHRMFDSIVVISETPFLPNVEVASKSQAGLVEGYQEKGDEPNLAKWHPACNKRRYDWQLSQDSVATRSPTPRSRVKGHMMDSLRNVLTRLEKERAALGHFNVSDLVLLKAILAAAAEIGVPVLVGASEGERDFFGVHALAAVIKSWRDETGVPVFLNADHTHSLTKAVAAVRAGFDAVVADFSALPFAENVARTKEAVETLKAINPSVLVEGEIGDIGTGSEIHDTVRNGFRNLTTPEESRQFVASTGIDIFAPAVGNMHGMLNSMVQGKEKKRLNIERIGEIKKAAGVFLTLHGGSGTDDSDFREAIAAGINIVHINTELRVAWRQSLEDSLNRQPNEVVPYKILPPVVDSVKQVAASRLKLFNAQGKRVGVSSAST